jgi:hypothetical protein
VKTTRNLRLASVVVCAALLGGCATPEARIKGRPDVFARLSPDQQALVKSGKVAPGLDMDAVRLALGEPDRVVVVTNAARQFEVWHYDTYDGNEGTLYLDGFQSAYNVTGGPYYTPGPGLAGTYPEFRGREWGDSLFRPNTAVFFYAANPDRPHERIRVVFDTKGRVAMVRQRNS